MRKSWVKKAIAISIIALFVEAGLASANYGNQSIISKPLSLGNTLYVGGIGPNNYTKIQKAIDNASDGDTVFVYDDSSPYYENVVINKSITLQGENKYSTIIDAQHQGANVIVLKTDNIVDSGIVWVNGFTMQNCYTGIGVGSNYWHLNSIRISDNIIKNNTIGIKLTILFNDAYYDIEFNHIEGNEVGLQILGSDNPHSFFIQWNKIRFNNVGIEIKEIKCLDFLMWYNIFYDNTQGLYLEKSILKSSEVKYLSQNHFEKNDEGIYLTDGSISNNFRENNFINNTKHVNYRNCFYNMWRENYWDNWIGLKSPIFSWLPKGIIGRYGPVPWLNFDWYPASEPYNITTGLN